MLAAVLDRDGQQRSATQTRSQALADADHLAILHAIWAAETTPARDQAYRDQRKLAASYQVLEAAYRQREAVFAQTMADRAAWDQATRAPASAGCRRRR